MWRQLLKYRPVFARSSRVLRKSDSSKRRQLGLPSKTSSLIGAGHIDIITFPEKRNWLYCFSLVFCLLPIVFFSSTGPQIAEARTKSDMSYLDAPNA